MKNKESTRAVPKGWCKAGSHPEDYDTFLDRKVTHDGKGSGSVKGLVKNSAGFGNLMQTFCPAAFLGKRVRLSGYVKSKDVRNWAGLWMRVDNSREPKVFAFDNMQDRPIKGTIDWAKYEIVLDVAKESGGIAFGLLLIGWGQVWMADLKFEIVGKAVATTGGPLKDGLAKEPVNLDFGE